MYLSENLQELLPEQSYVYQLLKQDPSWPEPLKEISDQIDQASAKWNAKRYFNPAFEQSLQQAQGLLQQVSADQREQAWDILQMYLTSLLAAQEMVRGEFDTAAIQVKKAIKQVEECNEMEESALSWSMLASLKVLMAEIANGLFDQEAAVKAYNQALNDYEKALKLADANQAKRIRHSMQRIHQSLTLFAENPFDHSEMVTHLVEMANLGKEPGMNSFSTLIAEHSPSLASYFDRIFDIDLRDPKEMNQAKPHAQWSSFLYLDEPDIHECAEIINFHYGMIDFFMKNEQARESVGWYNLDTFMEILHEFMHSDLYQQILDNNPNQALENSIDTLYNDLVKRYEEEKERIQNTGKPSRRKFNYSILPEETLLKKEVKKALKKAKESSKEEVKEENFEKALIDLTLLGQLSSHTTRVFDYLFDLYQTCLDLGRFYLETRQQEKAILFLEKGMKFIEDLALDELKGIAPIEIAKEYQALSNVLLDAGDKEKAELYAKTAKEYERRQKELEQLEESHSSGGFVEIKNPKELFDFFEGKTGESFEEFVERMEEDNMAIKADREAEED